MKGALAIKDGNSGVNDAMNGLYEGIKTLKRDGPIVFLQLEEKKITLIILRVFSL